MGKIVDRRQDASAASPGPAAAAQQAAAGRPVEVRRELGAKLKEAHDLLRALGLESLAREAASYAAKAVRDRFSVTFTGEFSHGKSTLINRLTGLDILPVDDLPTTALPTRIRGGRPECIEVCDHRGKVLERLPLTAASWQGLTAFDDEGNPMRREDFGYVTVTVDCPWLEKAGIDLLDTPGANDGSKKRDADISRALMVTDGAVACLDVTKGLMASQTAFLKDRLLGPKVPYVAVALTHADLVAADKRERLVRSVMAQLKAQGITLPVVVANDMDTAGTPLEAVTGVNRLRGLLESWSRSPERSARLETWLASNIRGLLLTGAEALAAKKEVLSARGDERERLITEKQKEITDTHDEWERLRSELMERADECRRRFRTRRDQEKSRIAAALQYQISGVNDPAKWYERHYAYQMEQQLSASVIALDNSVTEKARNDYEWLSGCLAQQFKARLERDADKWSHTPGNSEYVHGARPELKDISSMSDRYTKITAGATAVGGVLGALLFGIGGIVGSMGAGTAVRFMSKHRIENEAERGRQALADYVQADTDTVMEDATRDCEARIGLLYGDMVRAAKQAEASWMTARHEAVRQAARPAEENDAKEAAAIDGQIKRLADMSAQLEAFETPRN